MTGGNRDEKTARKRLSPPSTGSTYTMSARESPVCGRACLMLSTLTAITGTSLATGSPVNGDSSRRGAAAGGLPAGPGLRATKSPAARPTTATAAETAARIFL